MKHFLGLLSFFSSKSFEAITKNFILETCIPCIISVSLYNLGKAFLFPLAFMPGCQRQFHVDLYFLSGPCIPETVAFAKHKPKSTELSLIVGFNCFLNIKDVFYINQPV